MRARAACPRQSLPPLLVLLALSALARASWDLFVRASRRALARARARPPLFVRAPPIRLHSLQWRRELGDADYAGYFEKVKFREWGGAYPVMAVASAFLHCERGLHVISRVYRRTPATRSLPTMNVSVVDAASGESLLLTEGEWHVKDGYESTLVGIFQLPERFRAEPCSALATEASATMSPSIEVLATMSPPRLRVQVQFHEANATFDMSASPRGAPSRFAACVVFSSSYLLLLWTKYYAAIGVSSFYFYYNGDNETDIEALQASLSDVTAHIRFVHWPILHWIITDNSDITHGQPMAITDCLHRWRDAHEWLLFYDLDEFLVLPHHDSLASYVDAYVTANVAAGHGGYAPGPPLALRSSCAWAVFDLAQRANASIADLKVEDFALVPILRNAMPSGREKYLLNASSLKTHNLQIHGLYLEQERGEHVVLLPTIDQNGLTVGSLLGAPPAYHLHLLNTMTEDERGADSRNSYLVDRGVPIRDIVVPGFIRRVALRLERERLRRGKK